MFLTYSIIVFSNAKAIVCDGILIPTLSWLPVIKSLARSVLGNINVIGPGQKACASFTAYSGISLAHLSRLVRYGFSRKVSAIMLWLLSALYGFFAVLISIQNFNYEFLILAIASVVWISLLALFLNTKDE